MNRRSWTDRAQETVYGTDGLAYTQTVERRWEWSVVSDPEHPEDDGEGWGITSTTVVAAPLPPGVEPADPASYRLAANQARAARQTDRRAPVQRV